MFLVFNCNDTKPTISCENYLALEDQFFASYLIIIHSNNCLIVTPLTSVTDAKGLITRYTYSGLDNLTQQQSPCNPPKKQSHARCCDFVHTRERQENKMQPKTFSESQIFKILKAAENGRALKDLC